MKLIGYLFHVFMYTLLPGPAPVVPQPFSIAITPAQQRVERDSHIGITLTLTNISSREITLVDTNVWCDYALDVRDSKGEVAPETDFKRELNCGKKLTVTSGRRIIRTLRPGQSYEDLIFLDQSFNLSRPDTYTVQATRQIPQKPGKGSIKSNTITITAD